MQTGKWKRIWISQYFICWRIKNLGWAFPLKAHYMSLLFSHCFSQFGVLISAECICPMRIKQLRVMVHTRSWRCRDKADFIAAINQLTSVERKHTHTYTHTIMAQILSVIQAVQMLCEARHTWCIQCQEQGVERDCKNIQIVNKQLEKCKYKPKSSQLDTTIDLSE